MANEDHLAILKQGVGVWNRWRQGNPGIIPDLERADLQGAELRQVDFRRTNLLGAKLMRARLLGADLSDAGLIGADLTGANLRVAKLDRTTLIDAVFIRADFVHATLIGALLFQANLTGAKCWGVKATGAHFLFADLSDADLLMADLTFANLKRANVRRTNFTEAVLFLTTFADVDLSEAKGLETVVHQGPSTLGMDTFYKSQGKIPQGFLRGCGVPESLINPSLPSMNIEASMRYHSCFISYSSKDEEFARRLHARMGEAGLRVWFAPEDMKSGQKLHEQIDTAIRVYDKLLIVLSEASLRSEWVMTELRKARRAERQSGQRKLFPVRLVDMKTLQAWECIDPDTGEDLALEIRRYLIPDFSHWKERDPFEAAFARLLEDLRADEPAK